MGKKIVFGIIWCIPIYFGICILLGAIAGGMAGAADPENAHAAGARAGAAIVVNHFNLIIIGTVVLSIIGSITGVLPGTKMKKEEPVDDVSVM